MPPLIQDESGLAAIAREKALETVLAYGPKVVAAAAILVLGWFGVKIATGIVRRLLNKASIEPTLIGFVCNATKMALMTFVVVAVIERLGVKTSSFVAILAAAGFAIAFALQGSLGNFAAGVMIIFFRPFKAGDFVELAGISGVVLEVQIFSTKLRTGDNKLIIVPNGSAMGGNIVNYSAHDTRRVDLVFGIGYDDDIAQAKAVLERLVTADKRIHADPVHSIVVAELADSSVNFRMRVWVDAGDYSGVYFDMLENVKLAFDAESISIPYPQTDVHLHDRRA
jgi:small conductance mechanosensitive channel